MDAGNATTDPHVIGMAKHHLSQAYMEGGVPNVTATYYTKWAENEDYEKHLNTDLYRGPSIAAKAVAEYFSPSQRSTARILDVAAGTGFVAEFLKTYGFSKIDALDPSEGMLEKAREKSIYEHIICTYLDDNKLPILEDTYDCAVTSGGMGEGHIPWTGLDQLVRVVKPGGLITIVMREEYLQHTQYKDQLEPHMEHLVSQQHWEPVSRVVEPNYCFNLAGIVYKFRVLPGKKQTSHSECIHDGDKPI